MYICQNCKKAPATIHLTDIHNNVKKEIHLCEACAVEKGFNLKGAANLPHLLGLAAKKAAPATPTKPTEVGEVDEDLACPKCGLKWSQFGERGRLGCPEDYKVFDAQLRHLISSQIMPPGAASGIFHTGKKPGPRREEDQLDLSIRSLEKRLRQAVAEENYESAASLKAELDALRKIQASGGTA